ncbi:RNA-directed DNA polymerase, eukaryota [Tanacetum coccineum]
MGIGVSSNQVEQAASHIGCLTFTLSFSYLGVKVGGMMSWISTWNEVVQRFLDRLSKWKTKTLSIGGRLTLLKSVLGSMPMYHMSLFKTPMKVLNTMESIRAIHGDDGHLISMPKVSWSSSRGFSLKAARGGAKSEQFNKFSSKLSCVTLPQTQDRWVWSLEGTGEFSVASIRKALDDFKLLEVSSQTRWISAVPGKINIFAWKVRLDKIPTRLNLSLRGLDIESILCPLCGSYVESSSHLLFGCSLVKSLAHKIMI